MEGRDEEKRTGLDDAGPLRGAWEILYGFLFAQAVTVIALLPMLAIGMVLILLMKACGSPF